MGRERVRFTDHDPALNIDKMPVEGIDPLAHLFITPGMEDSPSLDKVLDLVGKLQAAPPEEEPISDQMTLERLKGSN